MTPTVSVILPCYNRQDTIKASINSVLTQSFADFELIVVDDGSKQDIKSVLDTITDPRLRYIRRARNGGAAAARNTGVAAAKGQFISFQDSDDLWLPGKLERQLALFAQLPADIGVVTSHRIIYGRDAQFRFGSERVCVAPSLATWPRGQDQVGAMLLANRLSLPCSLFRRDVLPGPDWFDTCARANEDWEFAVRISQFTRIHEDDRPVMLSYISADSISGNRRKQSMGTVRILRKNRALLENYPRQHAAIMLDISRTLAATGKPRQARKFLLQSLSIHPSASLLLAESLLRRAGRIIKNGVDLKPQAKVLVGRMALYAHRNPKLVPPAMRRLGRAMLGKSLPDEATVDGWTKPLVGSAPLTAAPQAVAATPHAAPMPQAANDRAPLRCLIVTGVLDVGGTDEVAAFLARRLPEQGFETRVAHTGSSVGGGAGGRLPSLLRQQGISVHDVDPDGAAALVSSWPLWWLDVADKARVPFVETLHGMHDLFDTDWSEEARRARRKSKLIAVSELVRQQYLRCNRGFDPARIVTVPNSVDPDRVAPVDRQAARAWLGLKDEFLFVSLARHALQKNGYALIESFADVAAAHPDAHLLIAGRPDNRLHMNQLLQLRARLDCRDRIHLRDHAPWSGALLAAADAFVMNSYFEGWSLATMEALAAGLPVISSDVGGAREQIGDDGSRGVVVPNPLGDPLAVNWQTLGEALYGPQVNRAALVAAMNEVVAARQAWSARRESLRAESLARFRPEHALGGHAQALRASATSQPELTEAS
jgi:glycosyltransferase involved in cell wall biosynthesis